MIPLNEHFHGHFVLLLLFFLSKHWYTYKVRLGNMKGERIVFSLIRFTETQTEAEFLGITDVIKQPSSTNMTVLAKHEQSLQLSTCKYALQWILNFRDIP